MWVLEGNTKLVDCVHHLPCGVELAVSRKDGHVLLTDDSSISRHHATIAITHADVKNPEVLPKMSLTDCGAKYGTFVNGGIEGRRKEPANRAVQLNHGDRVRFGVLHNTWRVSYRPLVVTTSTIRRSEQTQLVEWVRTLGGHLVSDWTPQCSYLAMQAISLTPKVVCALAASCPIVTPAFFETWADAVVNKKSFPVAGNFQPPLQEVSLRNSCFVPDPRRQTMMQGRTFMFSSAKHLSLMGRSVTLAGGVAVEVCGTNWRDAAGPGHVLMRAPVDRHGSQANPHYAQAKELVESKGLRVVPDSDIGLAILDVSTDRHCNPAFSVKSLFRHEGNNSHDVQTLQIYATETQDTEMSRSLTSTRVVPETAASGSTRPSPSNPALTPPTPVVPTPVVPTPVVPTLTPPTPLDSRASSSQTNSTNTTLLSLEASSCASNSRETDRKRTRTKSSELMGPPAKVSRAKNHAPLEATQPLPDPSQDLPEPTSNPPTEKGNDSQTSFISEFLPRVHSTQRDETPRKQHNKINEIQKQNGKGSELETTETTLDEISSSNIHTVDKSIPFDPYTLPSLKTDEREPHHIDIKQELPSLPVDDAFTLPDDGGRRKRRNEEARNGLACEEQQSKKSRMNGMDVGEVARNIKQEPADLFVLPETSSRTQRRAEVQKNTEAPDTKVGNDLFSLPAESRAHRRQRQQSQQSSQQAASSIAEPPNQPVSNGTSHVQPQSRPVISKFKEEPVSDERNGTEAGTTSVQDVTQQLEKSLTVLEVTSLVVRTQPRRAAQTPTAAVNYKRFRKHGRADTALPRIIGGDDFIAHDEIPSSRHDFFQANPDIVSILEDKEAQEANMNNHDDLFSLPQRQRIRVGSRR